jgi:hypothetical protein
MKRVVGLIVSVLGLCLLLSCDSEKDQYAGLGDMVADRQEIRKNIAKDNQRKKKLEASWEEGASDQASDGKAGSHASISSVVVYEKQVEIWDADSKRPIAKGLAYMNKSGQIVKIKIYRK